MDDWAEIIGGAALVLGIVLLMLFGKSGGC